MAEIHDIIFCLNATNIGGQGADAHTILSVINPEYIPGLFSFSTIITILGLDIKVQHKLTLKFENDKEVVGRIDGMTPNIDDPSNLPEELKGINLSVDWNNINFKEEGYYTLSVYIDDIKVDEKRIYVKGRNQL